MTILRTAAALAASGFLLTGYGQNSPAPLPAPPAAAASQTSAPILDGPCPPDRIGSRTVAHDPVLVCTDSATGPRWVLSTAETTTTTTTTVDQFVTTITTACVPVNTSAQTAYLDTLRSSIRQTESAIESIQLVIDNGIRSRDAAARYADAVKADRDRAQNAFLALPIDTNADKLAYQERRLADANGVVASWNATITKARGDLDRAKKQKAEFEQKARVVSTEIAAAQAGCSLKP